MTLQRHGYGKSANTTLAVASLEGGGQGWGRRILFNYVNQLRKKLRENLQNAAYPEIVFCYIARKFAYFILPHIVLYFIFCHVFFVRIVSQRAHKDAHLFCLYFFSCHILCLLFCFNAQADYYKKRLSFYRTFQRLVLF